MTRFFNASHHRNSFYDNISANSTQYTMQVKVIPDKYIFMDDEKIKCDIIVENKLRIQKSQAVKLTLENSDGKAVWDKTFSLKSHEKDYYNKVIIDSSTFHAGVYTLKANCLDSNSAVKVVLEPKSDNRRKAEYIMYGNRLKEKDVKKIKELGFDKIQILVRWKNLEKSPGKYDFSTIDSILLLLEKYDLKLEISIGAWATVDYGSSYMVPKWIKGRMVSHRGIKVKSGTIWDPEYTDSLKALWEAIAIRYKDNKHVAGYLPRGPGNDHELAFSGSKAKTYSDYFHIYDYSDYAQKDWKTYLRKHNFSLDQVKENIRTGAKPNSWSEVELPRSQKAVSGLLWKTFMLFRRQKVADFYSELCEAIRNHDSTKQIILGHSGGWIPWGNLQGSYFDDLARIAGKYNAVIQKTGCEWRDQLIVMGEIASKYNTAVYSSELAQIPPVMDNFVAGLFWLMMYQVPAMTYVHWGIGEPFGNWVKWKPYLERIINSKKLYDNLELLIATQVSVDMGIYAKKDVDNHRDRVNAFAYYLGSQSYLFRVTTDQVDKKSFDSRILVDCNSYRISPELAEKYNDFINGGGCLILPFYSDQDNKYAFQKKHLGVTVKPEKDGTVTPCGAIGDVKINSVSKGISFDGSGTVLAKWNNGNPAVIEKKIGRGKVILIGFPVIEKYHNINFLTKLLSMSGVKKSISSNKGYLTEMGMFENDKEYLIIVYNHSGTEIKPEITVKRIGLKTQASSVKNIVNGKKYYLKRNNWKYQFSPVLEGNSIGVYSIRK